MSRLELQTLLEGILGSNNVYFQPPSNIDMVYPCIVYSLIDVIINHSNNKPYKHLNKYQITAISKSPEMAFFDDLLKIPTVKFERGFTKDNLNHKICSIYY